jgi:hypothetical protein
MKYNILLKILDNIRYEAPEHFKKYKPASIDIEKLNQARAKAFIHLYLKVKCGLTDFEKREMFITDGSYDGGVDAYYIDEDVKKLYLIQSKFRTTKDNFETKNISTDELVRMEIKRVLQGEQKDSEGNEFNNKILKFQKEWSEVRDQAKYDIIVLFLGNLKKLNDSQVRRLIDNAKYEVFDCERTYNELIFPLCSGTYYDPKEITIEIDLFEKSDPVLNQIIETQYGKYEVRILFVPIHELGRVLSKYKNSILQYNPRNYLSLSRNPVNIKIHKSILETTTNEFAILNNGITMIASSSNYSDKTGKSGKGQLIITKPQIINGGQTTYVLSEIFENKNDIKSLKKKEVLLKVVDIGKNDLTSNGNFLEEISNATNQQTNVDESDRRSNDPIQIGIQKLIYTNYGYFYGRKKGEFFNGIKEKYIENDLIIDRSKLIRAYLALKGDACTARRSSEKLFERTPFENLLKHYKNNYKEMFFAFLLSRQLDKLSRADKKSKWAGTGLKYRKMAIIAAIGFIGFKQENTFAEINKEIEISIKNIEPKWLKFENWTKKQKENSEYLEKGNLNIDNYYKGITLNNNLKRFFAK